MYKTHQFLNTFRSWDVAKSARFEVKFYKTPHVRATFGRWSVVLRGRRKGLCTLSKVSRTWGFCGISKKRWQAWGIWRGSAKMHFPWQALCKRHASELLGGQCADFLRGIAFRSIRSVGLLRWFCVTGAALRGRRRTLDRWNGKIANRIGTRPSALHSTFHVWRKSHRIASFLMLWTLTNEEVSQNCFVFDVVKFKNWGSLAELLRFQACR